MNPAVVMKQSVKNVVEKPPLQPAKEIPQRPKILVATIDPAIRTDFAELLQGFSFDTIWLKSIEAAKNLLSKEKIAACFCGFWLQDGTYRQLVRHVRRECMDTPAIILSGPASSDESFDLLAAMNLGAVDFLAYPYRKSDLKRLFYFAAETDTRSPDGQSTRLINPDSFAGEAA